MNEKLLKLKLQLLPEGFFLATCNDLPGLVVQGRTISETLEIARDVARKLLESMQEHGEPLPSGLTEFNHQHSQMFIPIGID